MLCSPWNKRNTLRGPRKLQTYQFSLVFEKKKRKTKCNSSQVKIKHTSFTGSNRKAIIIHTFIVMREPFEAVWGTFFFYYYYFLFGAFIIIFFFFLKRNGFAVAATFFFRWFRLQKYAYAAISRAARPARHQTIIFLNKAIFDCTQRPPNWCSATAGNRNHYALYWGSAIYTFIISYHTLATDIQMFRTNVYDCNFN